MAKIRNTGEKVHGPYDYDYVLPPSWANPVAFTSTVSYGS